MCRATRGHPSARIRPALHESHGERNRETDNTPRVEFIPTHLPRPPTGATVGRHGGNPKTQSRITENKATKTKEKVTKEKEKENATEIKGKVTSQIKAKAKTTRVKGKEKGRTKTGRIDRDPSTRSPQSTLG